MSLLRCPNELLLLTTDHLPHVRDLKNLLCVNQRLYFLLLQRLHRLGASDPSVLHWAITRQHATLALLLLNYGADPNTRVGSSTALHIAASSGAANIIPLLLSHGAHIDQRDASGRSALARAITQRHFAAAHVLLDNGASAGSADFSGATALHCAVSATRRTSRDTEALIGRLAASGAVVDYPDCSGVTPAHLAVARGHVRVARLLVQCGAEVFADTERGDAALRRAVVNNDVEMARLLLALRGADVNCRDGDGRTALHVAAAMTVRGPGWDVEAMVRMLLAQGADVCVVDNRGMRPAVAARRAPERVRVLLEGGAESGGGVG